MVQTTSKFVRKERRIMKPLVAITVLSCFFALMGTNSWAAPPGTYMTTYHAINGQWVSAKLVINGSSGSYQIVTGGGAGQVFSINLTGNSSTGSWKFGSVGGNFNFATCDGWQTFTGFYTVNNGSGAARKWRGHKIGP